MRARFAMIAMAAVLAWSAVVDAAGAADAACGKLIPPANGMYFGVAPGFSNESVVVLPPIVTFDRASGRQAVWTYFGQWWSADLTFPEREVRFVWRAGKIPFIRLNP